PLALQVDGPLLHVGRFDAERFETAELFLAAGGLPDAGEVRLAVGGARRRRGQVRLAVGRARHPRGAAFQPLSAGCRREEHHPEDAETRQSRAAVPSKAVRHAIQALHSPSAIVPVARTDVNSFHQTGGEIWKLLWRWRGSGKDSRTVHSRAISCAYRSGHPPSSARPCP